MRYVLEDTSVLTLAQWGSEKGRGVFCDNKAKDYKVWRTTFYTTLLATILLVASIDRETK